MEDVVIKFELTFDEANAVMFALGKLPYDQVAGLVEKLRQQAAPQLPTQPAPVSDSSE
jgi:hypothetical protein